MTGTGPPPPPPEPSASDDFGPDDGASKVAPRAVVGRVALYLRQLEQFQRQKLETVSSQKLGEALNLGAAQVRKDLAFFGQFGRPGIGYDIGELIELLRKILGVNREWPLALIGVGNLGRALLHYKGFQDHGFRIRCLFDKNEALIGQKVENLPVHSIEDLERVARGESVRLAVICVPGDEAQSVADRAVAAGVIGILNFAPVALNVPEKVEVVAVDLGIHLEHLAYHARNLRGGIPCAG